MRTKKLAKTTSKPTTLNSHKFTLHSHSASTGSRYTCDCGAVIDRGGSCGNWNGPGALRPCPNNIEPATDSRDDALVITPSAEHQRCMVSFRTEQDGEVILTNSLGTTDFQKALKAQGIRLVPFWPPMCPSAPKEESERLFGHHIREAIAAWRSLTCVIKPQAR